MKNWKRIIVSIFFLPLIAFAQKIRINEFDKFIKQRRIESFPLTLASAAQIKMAVSFSSIGSSLYLQLAGTGLGANRIEADDKVIFLLDNDSTITIKSKGYQNFDIGATVNSYKHHYIISYADLQMLVNHNLQALRKYRSEEYDDVHITKEVSSQFKKLCAVFMNELSKSNVSNIVRAVDLKEISKYIGDSVTVVGKISGGKYFPNSTEAVTLLNVGNPYPNELLAVVINGIDRPKFGESPETFYQGKDVRITGKVELYNKKPQIRVSDKRQLEILADTTSTVDVVNRNKVNEPPVNQKMPAIAPAFPGGEEVWVSFLKRNLNPPSELKAGENKTVIVRFLVTADGTVEDLQIVQSAGPSFDKEVLRVLKRMPKWKASIDNGHPVDAMVTQSVTFYSKETPSIL